MAAAAPLWPWWKRPLLQGHGREAFGSRETPLIACVAPAGTARAESTQARCPQACKAGSAGCRLSPVLCVRCSCGTASVSVRGYTGGLLCTERPDLICRIAMQGTALPGACHWLPQRPVMRSCALTQPRAQRAQAGRPLAAAEARATCSLCSRPTALVPGACPAGRSMLGVGLRRALTRRLPRRAARAQKPHAALQKAAQPTAGAPYGWPAGRAAGGCPPQFLPRARGRPGQCRQRHPCCAGGQATSRHGSDRGRGQQAAAQHPHPRARGGLLHDPLDGHLRAERHLRRISPLAHSAGHRECAPAQPGSPARLCCWQQRALHLSSPALPPGRAALCCSSWSMPLVPICCAPHPACCAGQSPS